MTDYVSEVLLLFLALLGGGVLGGLFFGGLWWTVKKGLHSAHAAAWFLTSSVVRLSLAVVGIYFITFGEWPRLLACLVGFVTARVLIVRLAPTHTNPINSGGVQQGYHGGDSDAT